MTIAQYRRKQRWLRLLESVYQTGAAEGFDWYTQGGDCPKSLKSDYDFRFYFTRTMRIAQRVTNEAIARSRGRYNGWMWAEKQYDKRLQEECILEGAADLIAGCESLLRQAA